MQAHPRAGRGAWRAPGWGRLGAGRLPEGPGTSAQSGQRTVAASETGPGRAPRLADPERAPTGRRGWRDAAEPRRLLCPPEARALPGGALSRPGSVQ